MQFFDLFLQFSFDEISFLFVENVHILESNFVAVDTCEPVFELFDGVGAIVFVGALSSSIFDSDCVLHVLFLITK